MRKIERPWCGQSEDEAITFVVRPEPCGENMEWKDSYTTTFSPAELSSLQLVYIAYEDKHSRTDMMNSLGWWERTLDQLPLYMQFPQLGSDCYVLIFYMSVPFSEIQKFCFLPCHLKARKDSSV